MKPLSEQLSEMSVDAKNAEAAIASAKQEQFERLMERRDQVRAEVEAAIRQVDEDMESASDNLGAKWNSLKAKVAADKETIKGVIAQRRHDRSIKRADNYADLLEYEAACSVDYAIAAIEQAKLAVIDAVAGGVAAQQAKNM
jgi:hypothetical protein